MFRGLICIFAAFGAWASVEAQEYDLRFKAADGARSYRYELGHSGKESGVDWNNRAWSLPQSPEQKERYVLEVSTTSQEVIQSTTRITQAREDWTPIEGSTVEMEPVNSTVLGTPAANEVPVGLFSMEMSKCVVMLPTLKGSPVNIGETWSTSIRIKLDAELPEKEVVVKCKLLSIETVETRECAKVDYEMSCSQQSTTAGDEGVAATESYTLSVKGTAWIAISEGSLAKKTEETKVESTVSVTDPYGRQKSNSTISTKKLSVVLAPEQ